MKIFLRNCNLALEVEKHQNISMLTILTLDLLLNLDLKNRFFYEQNPNNVSS